MPMTLTICIYLIKKVMPSRRCGTHLSCMSSQSHDYQPDTAVIDLNCMPKVKCYRKTSTMIIIGEHGSK